MKLSRVSLSAVIVFAAGCSEPLTPPTPALLKDAKAAVGAEQWIGQCPEYTAPGLGPPTSGSVEIDARLKRGYPPGSEAAKLVSDLRAQGFSFDGPCAGDKTIQQAWFRQSGGGWLGPYPAVASVNFKVDELQRIVWAYGRIGFVGP